MSTERVIGWAWAFQVTRKLVAPALLLVLLLAGCATSLADTSPEVIRYCGEATRSSLARSVTGCITRP